MSRVRDRDIPILVTTSESYNAGRGAHISLERFGAALEHEAARPQRAYIYESGGGRSVLDSSKMQELREILLPYQDPVGSQHACARVPSE